MKVIAINGSLRRASSNAALLRAAASVAPEGVEVVLYEDIAALPHFNPDLDEEGTIPPPTVHQLRAQLTAADAIIISSPEYAHGVPGALKNLLDWLVSAGELVGKPVALLNASPSGGHYAQAALLETLRTMNWQIVEEASLIEPFVKRRIAGELDNSDALAALRIAIERLAQRVGT